MNHPVRNLLLDLGGVLYEIDLPGTLARFEALRAPGAPPIEYGKNSQHAWFSLGDTGHAGIDAFTAGLREAYQLDATDARLREVWLGVLVGVLPGRVEAVERLAARYRLALLSNTNQFHFEHFAPQCKPMFDRMDHLFLSFEMGVRKPDPEIYLRALAHAGWKAEETLFADDSQANIEAAQALGLQTWWIREHEDFDRMAEALLA